MICTPKPIAPTMANKTNPNWHYTGGEMMNNQAQKVDADK